MSHDMVGIPILRFQIGDDLGIRPIPEPVIVIDSGLSMDHLHVRGNRRSGKAGPGARNRFIVRCGEGTGWAGPGESTARFRHRDVVLWPCGGAGRAFRWTTRVGSCAELRRVLSASQAEISLESTVG